MRMKLFPIVLVLAFAQPLLADPVVTIKEDWTGLDVTVVGKNYTIKSSWDSRARAGMTRNLEVTGKGIYHYHRSINLEKSHSKDSKRELYNVKADLLGDVDKLEVLELLVFGIMPYATPAGGGIETFMWDKKEFEFLNSVGFGPDIADKAPKVELVGEDAFNYVRGKLIGYEPHYLKVNGTTYCFRQTDSSGFASFWMDDFKSEKFIEARKKRFPNLKVIDERIKKADLDDRKASEPSKDATANLVAGAISSLAKVD